MTNLKEHLRSEIDQLQMNVVKKLNNIDEIKAVMGTFERMNEAINEAPEIALNKNNDSSADAKPKGKYKKRSKE